MGVPVALRRGRARFLVSGRTETPGLFLCFTLFMADARRGRFDVVLVWASDRIARSVKHYLEVLDELNRLNIEFISFRENIDTSGALGRAIVVIIAAIAELERSLIVERVRAGMRRARLDGQQIGRRPLELDRVAILHDRQRGQSLRQIAKGHRISTATVQRVLHEHAQPPRSLCDKKVLKTPPLNPAKSTAGSGRSSRAKRYRFRYRWIHEIAGKPELSLSVLEQRRWRCSTSCTLSNPISSKPMFFQAIASDESVIASDTPATYD
jgi:hypothetical protein